MKILAVSDETVDSIDQPAVKARYGDVNLSVGWGDLHLSYLDFLTSALGKPLLYVRGNHDCGRHMAKRGEITEVRGGRNIHRECVYERNLLIAGFEGSVRYKPHAGCMSTQREMDRFVRLMAPQFWWNQVRYGRMVDIIITHAPPWGIHDDDDLPHHGFKAYLRLMRWFRPRYLLHGHIHRPNHHEPQITQYHETTVINIFPSYVLDIPS